MPQVKKKFSRKEMKRPDEFLKRTWEFSEWAGRHTRQIIIVTVTTIVTVLVGAFMWSFSQSRQVKSSKQMGDVFRVTAKGIAQTEYSPGQEPPKDDETFGSMFHKDEALLAAYRKARDNARSGGIRKICTLGMASTLMGLERYDEARKEYESLVKDPSGMEAMMHLVYEGLGFAYEGLGRKDKALEQFKKLEYVAGGSYRELALYHQARIYDEENKKQEAAALYKQIADSINKAEELSPLLAYLQENISGKEGIDLTPSLFKSPGKGIGGPGSTELTPEMLEELKKRLEEMKKKKDLEEGGKEKEEEAGEKPGEAAEGKAPEKKKPAAKAPAGKVPAGWKAPQGKGAPAEGGAGKEGQ
jgi:tetratricopeptide (TPR) repeat protein